MSNCIIVVPIYKETLDYDEEHSIKQLFKILGHHQNICALHPKSLNLDYYKKTYTFNGYLSLDDIWFTSVATYSKLLLNKDFYKTFQPFDYMLIYQTDAWVFSDQLDYWCNKGYDYIGAPWMYFKISDMNAKTCGNGGFSLRKISWLIDVLEKHKDDIDKIKDIDYPEDTFIANVCSDDGNFPSFIECARFSWEINPHLLYQITDHKLPFGCHAYAKVYFNEFYQLYNIIDYRSKKKEEDLN